jgi:protoheme IX farnesyltransferase
MREFRTKFFGLTRVKLGIPVLATLSTVTGFILAADGVGVDLLLPLLGIFLLAVGSSALNQVQDRNYDSLMDRTKGRPIPAGVLSAREGFWISTALIVVGMAALVLTRNPVIVALGAFAVAWYNGVYTYLKRKTAFAVVPGAIIGSVPPVLGWVAGGGALLDIQILVVALFFFVWQIPHFWLLVMKYGKDYEKAGIPSMTQIFDPEQLARITFMWVIATAACCLAMPMVQLVTSYIVLGCLVASTAWLIRGAAKLLKAEERTNSTRKVFRHINYYALLVICLLSIDRVAELI